MLKCVFHVLSLVVSIVDRFLIVNRMWLLFTLSLTTLTKFRTTIELNRALTAHNIGHDNDTHCYDVDQASSGSI